MRLPDTPEIPVAEGGWVLLGERPGEEIALGLVGKFWRPVIEFAPIESAEEYGVACAPADAWISSQASARRGAGQRPLVAPSSSAAPANAESTAGDPARSRRSVGRASIAWSAGRSGSHQVVGLPAVYSQTWKKFDRSRPLIRSLRAMNSSVVAVP
jgi:hypothetical protein